MQTSTSSFTIRTASWEQDNAALRLIREQVFMQEQNVPEELEWDGEDESAFHLLAEDDQGNPIGTARMLADGHIGRVAVVAPWRGRGVGTALMRQMLETARERNYREIFLDAQVDAIDFYRKLGFECEGKTFLDAGIPHRHMVRDMYT
jgi:predicted GNAT family N-acyltransferase